MLNIIDYRDEKILFYKSFHIQQYRKFLISLLKKVPVSLTILPQDVFCAIQ
jgi:hypothetical protein